MSEEAKPKRDLIELLDGINRPTPADMRSIVLSISPREPDAEKISIRVSDYDQTGIATFHVEIFGCDRWKEIEVEETDDPDAGPVISYHSVGASKRWEINDSIQVRLNREAGHSWRDSFMQAWDAAFNGKAEHQIRVRYLAPDEIADALGKSVEGDEIIERMEIVAWIRDQPYQHANGLADIADAIESGDHRRNEG